MSFLLRMCTFSYKNVGFLISHVRTCPYVRLEGEFYDYYYNHDSILYYFFFYTHVHRVSFQKFEKIYVCVQNEGKKSRNHYSNLKTLNIQSNKFMHVHPSFIIIMYSSFEIKYTKESL